MALRPRVAPFGEAALLVELGDTFDEKLVSWAAAIADHWESFGYGPAVPAYASALLRFDPLKIAPDAAETFAQAMVDRGDFMLVSGTRHPRLVEVPTRYDGPDLEDVARRSRMSVDQLVAVHSGREYTAYFLGFLPGFAYCGRVDPRIVAPRLDRPRERVPAGSVAVADGQTAVYPLPSPGGWRLVGSTDLVLFDPASPEPMRIRARDRVRFMPR